MRAREEAPEATRAGHRAQDQEFIDTARECGTCGVLYDEDYCPRCEEMGKVL